MLSRPGPTEDAISAEAHKTCYLSRGSQKMLSRPRLTERDILTEAHRTCYLGQGSQKMLALPAPWLNLCFYRIGVWKSWKILHELFWRWFWQFTIHRHVGERRPISARRVKTSYLSSARKNVPSRLGAWERPISGVSCVDVVNKA